MARRSEQRRAARGVRGAGWQYASNWHNAMDPPPVIGLTGSPEVLPSLGALSPKTVDGMRRLLGWWREQSTRDADRLVQALTSLGLEAALVAQVGPGGQTRSVVTVCLGTDSETTRGWAAIDPDRCLVYTAPDGLMAHPDQLRGCPDWVAAEQPDPHTGDETSLHDWMFWSSGPRAINFQIGDVCNMHCTMCWQDRRRATQPRAQWHPEMRATLIQHVLEQHLADIDTVEFVSFGETMANPEFDEMVHLVEALGERRGRPFRLHLITNGSLLHLRRHMDILRLPGELTFSIDAADQQVYESIREGGSWHDVVGNLRAALSHPHRHTARRIGVNMTVFEPNVDGIVEMGAFAAGLGLDYLSILRGAGLQTTRAAGQEIDPQDPRLAAQLDRIRRTFPWLRLNDYATGRTLPALPTAAQPHRMFCPLPWRQFDVGPDGRAHPCCRSYATDLGDPSTAWTGAPLTALRRQILAGDVDGQQFPDCAACPNLGLPPARPATRTVLTLRPV